MLAKPVNNNREKSHGLGKKDTTGEKQRGREAQKKKSIGVEDMVIGTPRGHAKTG